MSKRDSIRVFSFDQEVEKFLSKKSPVSNQRYYSILFLLIIITICNASYNAMYGLSQAVGLGSAILISTSYLLGDFIVISMSPTSISKQLSKILMSVSLVGLVLLSIFSATAFLLSEQYQKSNYDIELLKDSIQDDRVAYQNYGKLVTAQRIERKEKRLGELLSSRGADGASAIYHFMAKSLGYPVEIVSLYIRVIWAANFVFAGIAISFFLANLYCPYTLKKQIAFLEKVKKSQTDLGLSMGVKPKVSPETGLKSMVKSSAKLKVKVDKGGSKRVGNSYDTGVEGDRGNRFREVEKSIRKGEVGTSKAEIKRAFKVGDDTARKYQLRLLENGVIRYKDRGRGYEVDVSSLKRVNGVA
jgi:hypothetical protein